MEKQITISKKDLLEIFSEAANTWNAAEEVIEQLNKPDYNKYEILRSLNATTRVMDNVTSIIMKYIPDGLHDPDYRP